MKWFIISQSLTAVIAGTILPFYAVFLQQASGSYSLFAYLYASFALAAALTHFAFGRISKIVSLRAMLVVGSIVPGIVLIFIPATSHIWQIYIIQIILGISLALQKSAEKITIAKLAAGDYFEQHVGNYHGIVALSTAIALFASAWLLDTFSVVFLFYMCGIAWIAAGVCTLKVGYKKL